MKVAIQMDPIDSINPASDTTYILALEAQKRDHELYYYTPDQLHYRDNAFIAECQSLILHHKEEPFYLLGEKKPRPVTDFDVLLVRQDPPFDMDYLTYTYLLELTHPKPLVINHPAAIRNTPEKLFTLRFPELIPPTLISSNHSTITQFAEEHNDIILKPLYAYGGKDIYHITQEGKNFDTIIEAMIEKYKEPLIAQRFLPEVSQGDKRIILIDGKAAGAINRVPNAQSIRSNLVRGGTAEKTELTKRDLHICDTIGPELKKQGIILAGIDVIGEYLTEVNVTSPTGIQSINHLNDTQLEVVFWDSIEHSI